MSKNRAELILAGVALCSFLPFLLLLLYWHPVGTHGFDWLSNWGGRFDDVSWGAQQQEWYTTTMGRYTSTGLLSSTSWWYTLTRARWVVALLLVSFPFVLAYVLSGLMKWRYLRALGWAAILIALWISQLSNPYDTLYRWSGLLTYHVGLLLTLVYAGALLRRQLLLATVAVVLAVGTNEVSLLHCGMITGAWWLMSGDGWKRPGGILLLFVAAAGAGVALAAPGNFSRAVLYEEAGSFAGAVLLTGASSAYLWLGWLGSGMVPLLIGLVWLANGPRLQLTRLQTRIMIAGGLLIVPVSLAPVLVATRGDSLPEGITDWQLIPVLLLLLPLVAAFPKPKVPKSMFFLLGAGLLLPPLLGGLGIDRTRYDGKRSAISRVTITGKAGSAWLQLLSGKAAKYDFAIHEQYAKAKSSTDTLVYLPPLEVTGDNYLYDATYDRRARKGGEPYFGYVVGKTDVVGKYITD